MSKIDPQKTPKRTDRYVIKISVHPAAKTIIEELSDLLGMKETILAGRIYEWFSTTDPTLQRLILKLQPPDDEADIARRALDRFIHGKGKK